MCVRVCACVRARARVCVCVCVCVCSQDAGRTQVAPGTQTVAAIGPGVSLFACAHSLARPCAHPCSVIPHTHPSLFSVQVPSRLWIKSRGGSNCTEEQKPVTLALAPPQSSSRCDDIGASNFSGAPWSHVLSLLHCCLLYLFVNTRTQQKITSNDHVAGAIMQQLTHLLSKRRGLCTKWRRLGTKWASLLLLLLLLSKRRRLCPKWGRFCTKWASLLLLLLLLLSKWGGLGTKGGGLGTKWGGGLLTKGRRLCPKRRGRLLTKSARANSRLCLRVLGHHHCSERGASEDHAGDGGKSKQKCER